jgi:His-Xaa-Ser system radical SAM maturase HxsC
LLPLSKKRLVVRNCDLSQPLISKVTTNPATPIVLRPNYFYIGHSQQEFPLGFSGYLLTDESLVIDEKFRNIVSIGSEFSYISDGDIIRFNPTDSSVRVVYRRNSPNNYFLITEQCNSYCIMCSQPPRDIDDSYLVDEILETIPLIDKSTREIGLSGGEPTLIGDKLVGLIKKFKNYLPSTTLHILTNGRLFSNYSYAKKFESIEHQDCMFGVPLYADLPELHDYIVQADNAFDQTIKGILNLKKYGQRVEIRVVVHHENYSRLEFLAEYIARNLTFVDQVVFMGLEPTGFAKVNMGVLWIDPVEYQKELVKAINILDRYRIVSKIYNIQLCLLDPSISHKSVRSISDWKTEYIDECLECVKSADCCGLFGTGTGKHSDSIKAITL